MSQLNTGDRLRLTTYERDHLQNEVERLRNELADARAAASTWKRLARRYRGACQFLGGLVNERDAWIAGMSRDLNAVEVDDASR